MKAIIIVEALIKFKSSHGYKLKVHGKIDHA